MLRVHALYNRSRGVLIILLLLLAGQFTAVLYSAIRTSQSFVISILPGVPWPGCIMSKLYVPGILMGWVPDLIISTILFFLTMWNLMRSVLHTRGWRAIFQRNQAARRIPPLFTTFFSRWDRALLPFDDFCGKCCSYNLRCACSSGIHNCTLDDNLVFICNNEAYPKSAGGRSSFTR